MLAVFQGTVALWIREDILIILLGLRHASDPDHLAAVTTLLAAEQGDDQGARPRLWG